MRLGSDSPRFATFARVLEESPALQAKELEMMARFAQVLADALGKNGIDPRDARIAGRSLIGVHRHFFRAARTQALEGKQAPPRTAARSDLERAYTLLEHGLGGLGTHDVRPRPRTEHYR